MISTLADQMSISAATITALEEELATLPKPNSTSVPTPPATKYFQFVPKMPTPRSWKEDEPKAQGPKPPDTNGGGGRGRVIELWRSTSCVNLWQL